MSKKIKDLPIYGGTSLGWLEDAEEVEKEELLLKDLSSRLTYGVIVHIEYDKEHGSSLRLKFCSEGCLVLNTDLLGLCIEDEIHLKPYLRPMSSMIEEEAKEISILYGFKDILSAKITDGYIDVVVDDGFCNTETRTIWYDEIISSIEIFDWLNAHYFDYRGLIEKGLALEALEGMYNIKKK